MKLALISLVFVVFVCGEAGETEQFVALNGLNEPKLRVREVEKDQAEGKLKDEQSKMDAEQTKLNDEQTQMRNEQNRYSERNSVLKIDVHLSDESVLLEKNNLHSEHTKEEESNHRLLKEKIDSSKLLNQKEKGIDSLFTSSKNNPEEKNTRNEFEKAKNVLKSCSWIVFLVFMVFGVFECSTLYYFTLQINGIIETIPSKTIRTCLGKLINFSPQQ